MPDTYHDTMAERLRLAVERHGFKWFDGKDYDLNLIGVRSATSRPGFFDDALFCAYRSGGNWRVHQWAITADPGTKLLTSPMNPAGAAIMAHPQQARGAYRIGRHKGRPALVQRKPVQVWRDDNRDATLDWGPEAGGGAELVGLNIHDSTASAVVGFNRRASAGCQVFAVAAEHAALMALAREAQRTFGPVFTYTLLGSADLAPIG